MKHDVRPTKDGKDFNVIKPVQATAKEDESFYCKKCKGLMLEFEYIDAWAQEAYDHPTKSTRKRTCCHCKQEHEITIEVNRD